MKKKVMTVCLMCMLVSLTACSGKTEQKEKQDQNQEESVNKVVEEEKEQIETEMEDQPEASETIGNESSTTLQDGQMRPEFKEAMDSYEAYCTEYCDFMERFNENPTDPQLLAGYGEIMSKLADMTAKFEAWNEQDLTTAELKYYMEVNHRVAQKMIDVSGQ